MPVKPAFNMTHPLPVPPRNAFFISLKKEAGRFEMKKMQNRYGSANR